MLSKQQFLDSVASETAICKHLFSKIPEGKLDYSPGENMRTTRELLGYLSCCALAPTECLLEGNWDLAQNYIQEAANLEAHQFPQKMDEQQGKVAALLEAIPDQDLTDRQVTLPWGAKMSLGEALINAPLKFTTAYRMQLFLYAKAAGAKELNTYNCWMGQDPPSS